ncbi:uncharacterized protein LOC123203222 isoform X3 [Mangifera indica]|uniref:uncharacterized protein LOC123203222 isoform X3 n=1 Tax=Mangifera indica TaxID=29780 RepID=UPI001CF9D495|nr:uncharacterized protein LOC123203222 isoform X3 [Mangifera indica]
MMLAQFPPSTRNCSISLKLASLNSPSFAKPNSKFILGTGTRRNTWNSRALNLTLAKAEGSVDSNAAKQPTSASPPFNNQETVFVTQENVPLEGVIQFDKPDFSSRINKWGRVALLAGGDVLALFLFSAIGRFSHGFLVFDIETLRTADPFIAGWFLSAYFLGGYSEDGRGMNGVSKAVLAAAKSWALGIPVLHLLRRYLGEYVHGLSVEALRISVWKGDVVLKDLNLKAEALNSLKLPVIVKAGFVGTVTLKVAIINLVTN